MTGNCHVVHKQIRALTNIGCRDAMICSMQMHPIGRTYRWHISKKTCPIVWIRFEALHVSVHILESVSPGFKTSFFKLCGYRFIPTWAVMFTLCYNFAHAVMMKCHDDSDDCSITHSTVYRWALHAHHHIAGKWLCKSNNMIILIRFAF